MSSLSIVIIFEQPTTGFPFLFTPIMLAPRGSTSFAMEDPKEPVPIRTTFFPTIGLLNKDINSLFFWFVIIFGI